MGKGCPGTHPGVRGGWEECPKVCGFDGENGLGNGREVLRKLWQALASQQHIAIGMEKKGEIGTAPKCFSLLLGVVPHS